MTYHQVCNKSNTTGVTFGAGTAYLSGTPEFTPLSSVGFVLVDLWFSVQCFVVRCLSFFFFGRWLYCLFSICGFWLPLRYLLWSTSLLFTLTSIQSIYLIINSASHTWFLTHFKRIWIGKFMFGICPRMVLNFGQSVILDPPTFFYKKNQKECYSRFVSILIYFL